MFDRGKHVHVSKARAHPTPALLNISLRRGTNTLAYFVAVSATKKKVLQDVTRQFLETCLKCDAASE